MASGSQTLVDGPKVGGPGGFADGGVEAEGRIRLL